MKYYLDQGGLAAFAQKLTDKPPLLIQDENAAR